MIRKIGKIGILASIVAILMSMAATGVQACHVYTPGYWKRHGICWLVDGLYLGDDWYTCHELYDILQTKPKGGNVFIIVARYTIAAKLSVAAGVTGPPFEEDLLSLIAQADEWFRNPVDREAGIAISEQLEVILEAWAWSGD